MTERFVRITTIKKKKGLNKKIINCLHPKDAELSFANPVPFSGTANVALNFFFFPFFSFSFSRQPLVVCPVTFRRRRGWGVHYSHCTVRPVRPKQHTTYCLFNLGTNAC